MINERTIVLRVFKFFQRKQQKHLLGISQKLFGTVIFELQF